MSDLPAPAPDELAASEPEPATVVIEPRQSLTGIDEHVVDAPEVHTNFAPDPPSTIGEGWPVGVFVGIGVETSWFAGVEYVIGDDGCITGPA